MRDKTRTILGQILFAGSIVLVVVWCIAMRVISVNLDPMCYPQLFDLLDLSAPVVLTVAVIAFFVGIFLMASTDTPTGGSHKP